MSEESLRKALKENPKFVNWYLGLEKPSKIRMRHVIIIFSGLTLLMGFYAG